MKKNIGLMALTGILVLASCGQGGGEPTPDTTKPAVSLAANPTTLTKDGGSVVLSGTATDDVGVSGVTITRNDGTQICTTTPSSSGAYSCTTSLPANSTANAMTYTYTATAKDAAGNTNTATASVSVAGTTVTPPPGGGDSSVVITVNSPANGAQVDAGPTQVTFNTSGPLTNVKCTVDGVDVNATVTGNAGVCTVNLTGKTGSVAIKVSGTDSAGKTAVGGTNVTIKSVSSVGPAIGPIMQPDANGYIDYSNYRNGGMRCIDQENWNPSPNSQPLPGTTLSCATYLKGNVDVTFNAPTGASRVEAWVHGSIDGSKTGALKYLYDGAPGGKITWNTTDVNGQQSRILYMVVRTYNGTTTSTVSYPFVVDNTGPQASDPDFEGAAETGSKLLRDFGAPNNNWAKGKVQLYTSNPNLSDLVYNPASEQIFPAGVDYVTYYMVPISKLSRIGTIQGQQRVLDIIANSSYNTGPVQYASPNFPNKRDFRIMFDGVGKSDGRYAIFSVTVDEMGNESASTTYENLGLDNTGPSTQAVALYDASPLPFPSADPQRYISDWFRISGSLVDNGIGFNTSALLNGGLSFCGQVLPSIQLFAPVPGSQNTIGFNDVLLDSNTVVPSDGECEVTFSAPDALGNVSNYGGQKVIFDNTDPTNEIQQPAEGATFAAGTTVNFESNISDVTSGINPQYTKTFWNDYIANPEAYHPGNFGLARTRANGFIAAPVEFRSDPINSTTPNAITSLNAGWFALYPGLFGRDEDTDINRPMQLHALAVDCAGNATIKNRRVMVDPVTDSHLPKLGDYDVYYRNDPAAYTVSPTTDASHWYVTGAGIFDTTRDINMDMTTSSGALANVGNPDSTGTFSRNASTIKEVNFFRQLEIAAWNNIVYYQTHVYDPVTATIVGDMLANTFDLYSGDPTLYVRGGSDLMTLRGAWGHLTENLTGVKGGTTANKELVATAPWWLAGDTVTSSNFYRTTTALRGAFAFAGASALTGMASDNVGTYRANMELTAVISTLNTTPASVLALTYKAATLDNAGNIVTAGDTVDRFQFVVTTPIALAPTSLGSPLPAGTYALQGRNPSTGAWESIPTAYSSTRGGVTYVNDNGVNSNLFAGVNNVQAIYKFGAIKYAEFRFAAAAADQFPGQSFTVNVQ